MTCRARGLTRSVRCDQVTCGVTRPIRCDPCAPAPPLRPQVKAADAEKVHIMAVQLPPGRGALPDAVPKLLAATRSAVLLVRHMCDPL